MIFLDIRYPIFYSIYNFQNKKKKRKSLRIQPRNLLSSPEETRHEKFLQKFSEANETKRIPSRGNNSSNISRRWEARISRVRLPKAAPLIPIYVCQ